MNKAVSRRHFLVLSSLLAVSYSYPKALAVAQQQKTEPITKFTVTVDVLKDAYVSEMTASKHYAGFCQKAIAENYPNIAYLLLAFSKSEKIHAENYAQILATLNSRSDYSTMNLLILDTRANLNKAAENELIKINETYPDYLQRLKSEMHDQAVINCMYAWKSHRQHEEKIEEIEKYSKRFFSSVAEELEGQSMNFHVCRICGSTVDEPPEIACEICNYPAHHYLKIDRPSIS